MLSKHEFESRVLKTSCGCWLWLRSTRGAGYGQVNETDDPSRLATRFAYKMYIGGLEDHLVVRHTCDIELCVNPAHLVKGTHKDNTRDAIDRGRFKLPPRTNDAFATSAAREALKARYTDPEFRRLQGERIRAGHAAKKLKQGT